MNTRNTTRSAANDPDLIHSSSRNCITTNASATPGEPARTTLRTTRLDMRWIDGDMEIRFVAHAVDVTPRPRTMPRRGAR